MNNIKVSIKEEIKDSPHPGFPYIAKYCDDIYVLVTGPNTKNPGYSKGIMINGNKIHEPFEYEAGGWVTKDLVPFKGKIVIEVS